ncbi:phenylacetyl-CoA ligase [Mycena floridula]|nr:phenylacetyl-CoA ligase [Mycena floridula]
MTIFRSPAGNLPDIPTDLSITQFLLDSDSLRPPGEAGRPWLIEESTGRKIGLDELRSRTLALANALAFRYAIREDDVVLMFSRNHVDYPVAIWAAHRLGAIVSGANPEYSSHELQHQIEISKASFMLVDPDSLHVATSAAQQAGLPLDRIVFFNTESSIIRHAKYKTVEDLVQEGLNLEAKFVEPTIDARTKVAFLCFSSGTTGTPKAVAMPHGAVITNMVQLAAHHKVNTNYTDIENQRYRPGDVAIAVLPFYHAYGLVVNLHFILFCGLSIVVVPRFNFVEMLRSIKRHHISHLFITPPIALLLCKHPAVRSDHLNSVRYILIGAAPLSDEVSRKLFKLLPNAQIGQGYGSTETCVVLSAWPADQKRGKSGSAGQLVPGVIARIVKEDGTLAGYDETGELQVHTPSAALCYYNDEKATRETFVDGWVKTGDLVKIDSNTEVWVIDRLKEIMKTRGFQVSPSELEGSILDHPDVSECCVVGIPDEFSGEVPLAFVVLSEGTLEKVKQKPSMLEDIKASISKHVSDNKISYKHLAGGVEIVSAIPKNPSGKLLRRVLRDQAKEVIAKRGGGGKGHRKYKL